MVLFSNEWRETGSYCSFFSALLVSFSCLWFLINLSYDWTVNMTSKLSRLAGNKAFATFGAVSAALIAYSFYRKRWASFNGSGIYFLRFSAHVILIIMSLTRQLTLTSLLSCHSSLHSEVSHMFHTFTEGVCWPLLFSSRCHHSHLSMLCFCVHFLHLKAKVSPSLTRLCRLALKHLPHWWCAFQVVPCVFPVQPDAYNPSL